MHKLLVQGPPFANHRISQWASVGAVVPTKDICQCRETFLAVATGGYSGGGKVSASGGHGPGKQRISESEMPVVLRLLETQPQIQHRKLLRKSRLNPILSSLLLISSIFFVGAAPRNCRSLKVSPRAGGSPKRPAMPSLCPTGNGCPG